MWSVSLNRLSRSSIWRLCCCDGGDSFAAPFDVGELVLLASLDRFDLDDDDFLIDDFWVDDFNVSSVETVAAAAGDIGFISAVSLLLDPTLIFLSKARLLICSDNDVGLDGDDPMDDDWLFKLFSPDLFGEEIESDESPLVRLAARAASCSANDDIVLSSQVGQGAAAELSLTVVVAHLMGKLKKVDVTTGDWNVPNGTRSGLHSDKNWDK